jgi:hypothetical protein
MNIYINCNESLSFCAGERVVKTLILAQRREVNGKIVGEIDSLGKLGVIF